MRHESLMRHRLLFVTLAVILTAFFVPVCFSATTDFKTGAQLTYQVPAYDPSQAATDSDSYGRYSISDILSLVTSSMIADFDSAVAANSAVSANTAKTGITSDQESAIVANTAKVSYPGDELTSDELAAVQGASTPSGANAFATVADIPTDNSQLANGAGYITSQTDDQTAAEVPVTDAGGNYTGTNAETIFAELPTKFATAAQGTLADSALQSGDNISVLTNDSGYQTAAQVSTAISGAASNYATAAQGATADTALQPGDVDDTPVTGATTAPVSSNWAYTLINASDPFAQYLLEDNAGSAALLDATNGTIGDVVTWINDGSGNASLPIDVAGASITDTGGYFTTDTIEGALQELGAGGGSGFSESGDYSPTGTWDWSGVNGATTWPTFNQNTSGTAAGLSGTPALPNGTTATTQTASDNSTKIATTAYVDAAASAGFAFDTFPTYEDSAHSSGIAVNGTKLAVYSSTAGKWLTASLTDTLDPTPASYPTLSSAAIGTDGTTLTLGWSESVSQGSGYADSQLDLDASTTGNDIALTYSSGDGTATWVYTTGSTIQSGETIDLDFDGTANSIEDAAGDDLQAIVSASVTNNSTQSAAITCTGGRVLYWPMESTTDVAAGGGCSVGATTATTNETPTLSATYFSDGSNSLQINAQYEYVSLPVLSRDIVSELAGTFTFDVWFGSTAEQRIVYARFDSLSAIIVRINASGQMVLDYMVDGQSTVTVASAQTITTATKYSVVAKWRQGTTTEDSLSISANSETPVTSTTVLSDWGSNSPAYLRVGTAFGHDENLYIDNLQVYTAWQ